MREFIVMVGLSGSGKSYQASTLAKSIHMSNPKYDEYGRADVAEIISSDSIREEILGDVNDQTQNDLVFKEVHNRIRKALLNHYHIIVDATNITIKSRKPILDCFNCLTNENKKNYHKVAYVMTTPISICKHQNNSRDRVVPNYVIDRQMGKFEIPFIEEGFDYIVLQNWDYLWAEHNTFDGAKAKDLEVITNMMKGFNQRTHHHKYTLDVHCQKLKEEIQKRTDDKVLIRTALIHDIGKLFTGKPKDDGSGDYCYYSHHNVGTYSLLQNLDKVAFWDKDRTLDLLFYVNYHMQPFFMTSEKSKNKWKNIFGEEKFNNLIMFNECDKIASGSE